MKDFEENFEEDFEKGNELIKTYQKNGFSVKTYKSIMTDKERTLKDAQIKYDILNTIKDLTVTKVTKLQKKKIQSQEIN